MPAENLIWIFGTTRVGSTWLGAMMEEPTRHERWREPMVGLLFGAFFHQLGLAWNKWTRPYRYEAFIFSAQHKETWLATIRGAVLDGARARHPEVFEDGYLVVQEPNGSVGAPWLMEALPESRMVFMVRDPRDVVASMLDAYKKGGWFYAEEYLVPYKFRNEEYLIDEEALESAPPSLADTNPDAFVKERARVYRRDIRSVRLAYEAHQGPKTVVRYEDLRANTLDSLGSIYSALRIDVDAEELGRVVERHAWENVPEDSKGKGKVRRKATPGAWKEELTPKQVRAVERITAPLLEEFYPK